MKRLLLGLIRFYQLVISPLLGPRCRYIPTCSQYALQAVVYYGAVQGSWLACRRIGRCHPFGGSGYDPVPVPPRHSRHFIWFKPVDGVRGRPPVPFIDN